jgi:hypothetical protein
MKENFEGMERLREAHGHTGGELPGLEGLGVGVGWAGGNKGVEEEEGEGDWDEEDWGLGG